MRECISSVWDVNSESCHIFFAWNITTNLFRRARIIVSQNAHRSRDAIKLRISRWSPLRDRFASFISLSPTLHLFTIRARLGRRKQVICYNVFSLFGRPGRSRLLDGNISRNRNMHGTCYAYTQTGKEKISVLYRVGSVNSCQIYCVFTYVEINPAWIICSKVWIEKRVCYKFRRYQLS